MGPIPDTRIALDTVVCPKKRKVFPVLRWEDSGRLIEGAGIRLLCVVSQPSGALHNAQKTLTMSTKQARF